MKSNPVKASFTGHSGAELSARLDLPSGPVRAWALFAHCFTCGKDLRAAREIAAHLSNAGIAVMRFDFTGLGSSEGEFASTSFSSNVEDLVIAAKWLEANYKAPAMLLGHSLGGAAVLAAAPGLPSVKAVVTVGAPADTEHVLHQFGTSIEEIEQSGEAKVNLAGRDFTIAKKFVEDARMDHVEANLRRMKAALLVLHSPFDNVVGIENAAAIFKSARHPKSFVSLDQADHLLSKPDDARYAAKVISGWLSHFLPPEKPQGEEPVDHVRVAETGIGKFQQSIRAGRHRFFADEPESYGGLDSGPSPYDLLAAAIGACTTMTLRMYIERKGWDIDNLSVEVSHAKIHVNDCAECSSEQQSGSGRIDRFERVIELPEGLDAETRQKLLEIADKCPVHRTLEASSVIATRLADGP